MRISHRHRFIFFAFPKTGSRSLRKALQPYSDVLSTDADRPGKTNGGVPIPTHIRPLDLRPIMAANGWPFDAYFRFVFVRNPWSRLVSLYRMIEEIGGRRAPPFDAWLMKVRTDGDGAAVGAERAPNWARYGTYTLDNFVGDENGRRLVDRVFRLEDMAAIPDELCHHGIPIAADAIRRENARPPVDLNAYYTSPALKAIVAMRYASDIAEFGYSYPS